MKKYIGDMRIHSQDTDGAVAGGAAAVVDVAGGAAAVVAVAGGAAAGVAPPPLASATIIYRATLSLGPGLTIITIPSVQCGEEKT